MFLVPFLWPLHTQPLVTFYSEWIAAVLLIVACLAATISRYRRPAPVFDIPAVTPVFVPLMVVILIQWGLGRLTYSSDALLPLMTLALATAAIVFGRVLAREVGLPQLLCWLAVAAVAGGLLNIAVQILQLCAASGIQFSYLNFHSGGQYFGALAQRNHLSTYLSWGVAGALYLYATGRLRANIFLPLITILLTGMALTLSRTGWLQVVWIALAAAWMMRLMPPDQRPWNWKWVLCLPALYAVVNIGLPYVLEGIGLSFSGSALERVTSESIDGGRRMLYSQGAQIFLAHPLLGVGPGQLFFAQFQLLDQVDRTLYANSTHNIVLDLLVMTGAVGALPFLLLAGAFLRRLFKQVISLERAAALLMLSTLGIHMMLELPHWYGFFLLPAAFLCGALDSGSLRLPRTRFVRALPVVLCVYGLVVAISIGMQYRELERMFVSYYTKDRHRLSVDEPRLLELLVFQRTTWFTGVVDYLLFTSIALNEVALPQKLAIASRAIRQQPEPHVVYRYVLLLALDGRQDEGLVALERTRKMFPEAYKEIAAEFVQLAEKQPALFGRLGEALRATVQLPM
jgi:O-antigen ligase